MAKKKKAPVKQHRGIGPKDCPRCHTSHSASVHKSHGKGSFQRTHPAQAALGEINRAFKAESHGMSATAKKKLMRKMGL